MACDVVVDDHCAAYAYGGEFHVSSFQSDSMAPLLRIERGRVANREVFGPIRLHYGFFKLADRRAEYLVAHDGADGPLVGAIGFIHDEHERAMRVFELIARSDDAPRFLLDQLVQSARYHGVEYVEIDVSAHAPRMQRTLIEMGFFPAAYVPALVFDDVERIDIIKMVRLLVKPDISHAILTEPMQPIAETVMGALAEQTVLPQIEDALDHVSLFGGLDFRQRRAVASLGVLHRFEAGQTLFASGERVDAVYVVLSGIVAVRAHGGRVGEVGPGESIGEVSLVTDSAHSATAVVEEAAEVVSFDRADFDLLTRRHPDVGLILYRNLASGLGDKLRASRRHPRRGGAEVTHRRTATNWFRQARHDAAVQFSSVRCDARRAARGPKQGC